jgi:hypothetical protein
VPADSGEAWWNYPDLENALGIDVHGPAWQLRDQTAQTAELRRQAAGQIRHAESEDGQVRLGYSPAHGLPELSIDPRATRSHEVQA